MKNPRNGWFSPSPSPVLFISRRSQCFQETLIPRSFLNPFISPLLDLLTFETSRVIRPALAGPSVFRYAPSRGKRFYSKTGGVHLTIYPIFRNAVQHTVNGISGIRTRHVGWKVREIKEIKCLSARTHARFPSARALEKIKKIKKAFET